MSVEARMSEKGVEDDVVEISEQPLEVRRYTDAVRDRGAGAIASFAGTTREIFEDRKVVRLEYEAYVPMVLRRLRAICASARQTWSLIAIAVAHRVGIVPVGEESVFVAVSSVHRKDSLEACRYIIDEIKASAPIWKKEIYEDGEAAWKENAEFYQQNSAGFETKHCDAAGISKP